MLDNLALMHLQRMRAASTNQYTRADLLRWVCNETYLNGRKFSTKGHEYQERILMDQSQELAIKKPSQVGISELSLRMALGLVTMIPNFSLIYTMPTATLASLYTKTRLDPIIQNSPALRDAIRGELDSSESKQLGANNFLYMRGSTGSNAAISVAADCVITDEVDFSDPNVVEMMSGRLTHSQWKMRVQLSTPTTPNGPIDKAFKQSRRHFNFVKCSCCGHRFWPTYWNDVKIPGFSGSLREITKESLYTIQYKDAAVHCPRCGGKPSLQPEFREWVCENPTEGHICAGYQVSPFDAPDFIPVHSLVSVSTKYIRPSQFANFHLGEVSSEAADGLVPEDIDLIGVDGMGTAYSTHTMGVDLGHYCHVVISGMGSDMKMGIVHYERIPLAKFRERYFQLKALFNISIVTSDLQPYSDLLMSIAEQDPQLFAASYVTRNGLELFDVKQRDADPQAALGGLRQVSINRNAMFDQLLANIREGKVWVKRLTDWELFKAHMCDMRRATPTLRNGEMAAHWTKSAAGNDHYHHATLYALVASQMRGLAGSGGSMVPMIKTFKVKSK